jgi:predicted Zn-dependent peptidase
MYRKTVLANGLSVVTETLPYFPTVSLGLWWKTGSRHETAEVNGISHFIEHMLFKGTEQRTAYDIAREIDAVGGSLNAFTGKEYTCLYARVLRRDMLLGLDVICDMYKNSLFKEEDIEHEKQVVIQEIKMIEDNPEEYIFDIFNASYYRDQALGLPILGSVENVEGFTRDMLLHRFANNYSPANAVMTATGRFDHDALVAEAEKRMSGLPGFDLSADASAPPVSHTTIDIRNKDLEHTYVCIGTDGTGQMDERRYPLYALNAIVGGSMSSHLFQEIREKRGLAYNIFSYVNCFRDVGTFGISTSTSDDLIPEVIGLIKEEVAAVGRSGVSDSELAFAKEHIKGNFFMSLESSEARMGRLAKNEIYFGRYIPLKSTLQEIEKIKRSQLEEVANLVCGDASRMSLVVLGPVDEGKIRELWNQ